MICSYDWLQVAQEYRDKPLRGVGAYSPPLKGDGGAQTCNDAGCSPGQDFTPLIELMELILQGNQNKQRKTFRIMFMFYRVKT